MGEKRHPYRVVLVRGKDTPSRKVELFSGALFSGTTFRSMTGGELPEVRDNLFRIRINGKWFPARRKILYSRADLNYLLIEMIGE